MAPADGGGNSSDGAPMGAGKAELTNPSRFKEPGACQQRIIVTPKPGKKKKKKIKRTPPEAVDVGSSTSTVTTKSSSPHDSEEEWQPSSLPGDGEAQQQGPWKRPRLVWTTEMHDKFVEAHTTLGKDAVPKKILELMNDPRLTRDNVASHLQKYRLSLQRSGQPVGTRKRGNATVTRIHHRAQPLQSAPPKAPSTALHRPPQGPCFATPSMSQQQQIGHGQLVQTPPNNLYSGNAPNLLHQYLNLPVDRPKLLHQHMNLPVAQPMPMQDRFNTAMLRATTATKHMLVTDQQAQQAARMKQAAAAASGYNRMPVRNYPWDAQMETRAPVASGLLINHRREPLTQAFKATNVIREYSFPEVNVGDERTERGTVRQQVGVKAETGQERAALPPAAAPADPDRSHQDEPMDDVEQYLVTK